MTASDLAARLAGRRSGAGWIARCPAHDDQQASLSIGAGEDNKLLVHCHAGCDLSAVLARLGLEARDLFPVREGRSAPAGVYKATRYEIRNAAGALLAVHVRENLVGSPKRMWWEQPDGSRGLGGMRTSALPLYGSERLASLRPEAGVILTEGEKAAEAIWKLGLPALGTVTGASGCPERSAFEVLRGRRVVLWPDADAPGRAHMDRVAQAMAGIAASVRVLTWGEPGSTADAADFGAHGGTRGQLIELVKVAPEWKPAPVGAPASAGPVLVAVSKVAPEAVRWLWLHRVPLGKLTVLDGDPGLGKSTLTLDLAARVSRGAAMPGEDRPCDPGGVVLLSAEDGVADTIRPRLEAAGADLERVHVLTAVRDSEGAERLATLPGDVGIALEALGRIGGRLLVVDPLMAFFSAKVDSHRDQDVRGALHLLADLAERSGAAVLIVRHLNKTGGGHPLYRGGGSIGIVGACRAGLLVAPDPADPERRVLAVTKSNLGPVPPSLAYRLTPVGDVARVEWDGIAQCSARDLLAAQAEGQEEGGARAGAADFLRTLLADGPMTSKAVQQEAEAAGVAWATVRRAKDRLGIHSTKHGGRFGGDPTWYWELPGVPEGARPAPEDAEDAQPEKVSTFREGEHLQPRAAPLEGEDL